MWQLQRTLLRILQDKAPQKWQQTAGLTHLSSAMLPPWTYLLQDLLPLKGFQSSMVNVPVVVSKIIQTYQYEQSPKLWPYLKKNPLLFLLFWWFGFFQIAYFLISQGSQPFCFSFSCFSTSVCFSPVSFPYFKPCSQTEK